MGNSVTPGVPGRDGTKCFTICTLYEQPSVEPPGNFLGSSGCPLISI